MDLEELQRIWAVNAKAVLTRKVIFELTEYDVAKAMLEKMCKFYVADRDIVVPGLYKQTELVLKTLAWFREKLALNFVPLPYAKDDDITIEPLRPEVFGLDTYKRVGLTVGTYHIIPTEAQVWSAVKDEEIIIITDIAEFIPQQSIVTAIQATVDGTILKPEEMRTQLRQPADPSVGVRIYELSFPWIADLTLDIDGKVEFAGDAEITPIGVHICLGRRVPKLT